MIWVWIAAAVLLSRLALGRQKITIEHYIWLLLPIDMYGLTISTFTLKPFMLFALFLFLRMIIEKKKLYIGDSQVRLGLGLMMLALLLNMLHGLMADITSSVMAIIMLIMVWFFILVYISQIQGTETQIIDAITSACIGYGTVLFIIYVLTEAGIELPGFRADTRMSDGIVVGFGNMIDGTYVSTDRLRGFSIDPNGMNAVFIPGLSISATSFFLQKNKKRNLYSLLISFACIFVSGSRSGIISATLLVVIAYIRSLYLLTGRQKTRYAIVLILMVISITAWIFLTDISTNITKILYSAFSARGGDTASQYSRLSLWKEAIAVLSSKNPFFGVGTLQVQNYTPTRLGCHNTWIEWICGCGWILGLIIDVYVMGNIYSLIRQKIWHNYHGKLQILYLSLTLGIIGIFIELLTIDNITSSYFWFSFLLLRYLRSHIKESRPVVTV